MPQIYNLDLYYSNIV